jgi:RecA/RadA recombinase
MHTIKELDSSRPIFVVVDSIAALQPAMALDTELDDYNMRVNMERSQFLSRTLPRWQTFAKNYTAWMVFINQIRVKPGVSFGNPEYTPAGNAMDHYCHVMIKLRRKGTKLEGKGNTLGIGGYMVNEKNKAGGGSTEGRLCSYRVKFALKPRKMWKFAEIKKKDDE